MPACSLNPLIGSREELDIVIVVAAGNRSFGLDGTTEDGLHAVDDYSNYLHDEDARLAEPAPAANALTVGSIALSDAPVRASGASHVDQHVIAGRNKPSPFSRTGPGVIARVKPELVHYGGDFVWSGSTLNRQDLGASCVSLNSDYPNHLFRAGSGTSFSAPRIANVATGVCPAIGTRQRASSERLLQWHRSNPPRLSSA